MLRVTVSRAPNVATAVALVSNNPAAASVPPQVNIAAGALFADFPVTANAVGQATITASLNGGSATSLVTVAPAELVTLTLSPQQPTNYVGEAVPFTATGIMTDGTSEDFTSRVRGPLARHRRCNDRVNRRRDAARAEGTTTIRRRSPSTRSQTGQPVTVTQSTVLTVKVPTALVLSAPTTTLEVARASP